MNNYIIFFDMKEISFNHDSTLVRAQNPRMHLSHPREFKNLVRMHMLKDYDFRKVYEDLCKSDQISYSIHIAYALKYAKAQGLFSLQNECHQGSKNQIKSIIQKIVIGQGSIEEIQDSEKFVDQRYISSNCSKVSIVLEQKMNQALLINEDNDMSLSISIKSITQAIKDEKLQQEDEQQDKIGEKGYEGSFWFTTGYCARFQQYLIISQKEVIKKKVLQSQFFLCLDTRYQGNFFGGTKFSANSYSYFDQFCLKIMSLEVIYKQVVFHNQRLSQELFKLITKRLLNFEKVIQEEIKSLVQTYQVYGEKLFFPNKSFYKTNRQFLEKSVNTLIITRQYSQFEYYKKKQSIYQKCEVINLINYCNQEKSTLGFMKGCLKVGQNLRVKLAKIVYHLFSSSPQTYKKHLTKQYLDHFKYERNRKVFDQISKIFIYTGNLTCDEKLFLEQYKQSLIKVNYQSKESRNMQKRAKKYILGILSNREIATQLFKKSFIQKSLEDLIGSEKEIDKKEVLTQYFDSLIRKFNSLSKRTFSVFVSAYMGGKYKKDAVILQTWILQCLIYQQPLQEIENLFNYISNRGYKKQIKLTFWLLMVYQIAKILPKRQLFFWEKYQDVWRNCILNQEPFKNKYDRLEISLQSGERENSISFFTSQLVLDSIEYVGFNLILIYLNQYGELGQQVKGNGSKIIQVLLKRKVPTKLITEQLLITIIQNIESERQKLKIQTLKQVYFQLYENCNDLIKQKLYSRSIKMIQIEERSEGKKSKSSLSINQRILRFISSNGQSQNLNTELSTITNILSLDAFSSLHRQAFVKSCEKIKNLFNPPAQLIIQLQKFVQRQFEKQNKSQFTDLSSSTQRSFNSLYFTSCLFKLPSQLSKQFITNCFQFFQQKKNYQKQFILLLVRDSNQQLETPLYNLCLQKQIIYFQTNQNLKLDKLQIIHKNISLIDAQYLKLIIQKFSQLRNNNKELFLYKILSVLQQSKNTKLFNIAEQYLNEYGLMSLNLPPIYAFLISKCQIMRQISEATIKNIIQLIQNPMCGQFYYLVASVIIKKKYIHCDMQILSQSYKKHANIAGSDIFTKSLISQIKYASNNSKEDKKTHVEQSMNYIYSAFDVFRQENTFQCINFVLEFSQDLIKSDHGAKILHFLRNAAIKFKHQDRIMNKIVQVIQKARFKASTASELKILEQLKFITMSDKEKMNSMLKIFESKKEPQNFQLQSLIQVLQRQKVDQMFFSELMKGLDKINEQTFCFLYQRLLKYQISHDFPSSLRLQFITIGLNRKKELSKNQQIYGCFLKYQVKFLLNQQQTEVFETIKKSDLAILFSINSKISIIDEITFNKFNQITSRIWFSLVQPKSQFLQVAKILIIKAYQFIGLLPQQQMISFVENVLLIPSLDTKNRSLILLVQQLILRNYASQKILEYYLTCMILLSKEELKMKEVYKLITEKNIYTEIQMKIISTFNILQSQLEQQKDYELEQFKDEKLFFRLLQFIGNQKCPQIIRKLSWRCLYSICHHSYEAQLLIFDFLKTKEKILTNYSVQITFVNLALLSSYDTVPNYSTVTQMLLIDFLCKYQSLIKKLKHYSKYQFQESVEELRNASHFLIERQIGQFPETLLQNQLFIQNLAKLLHPKVTSRDILLILQLASENFSQISQGLSIFGQNYPLILIHRETNLDCIQKQSQLLEMLGFYNCLNLMRSKSLKNQIQKKQILKLTNFLSKRVDLRSISINFTDSNTQEIKIQLLMESIYKLIIKIKGKDKVDQLLKRICARMLKSEFFQQLFEILVTKIGQNCMKPYFCDGLQTFCDYILDKFGLDIENVLYIGESYEKINQQYILLKGKSHEKDLSQILNEFKKSGELEAEEIEMLRQYLLKFEQLAQNHEQNNLQKDSQQNQKSTRKWIRQKLQKNYYYYLQKLKINKNRFFTQENCLLLYEITNYYRIVSKQNIKKLRYTQIIAIWIGLNSILQKKQSKILQVCTGQGKSLIIAGIAVILAIKGFYVQIITSSPVLAARDSKQNQALFTKMGIKCSHNIDDISLPYEKGKKKCYQSPIVYGTCIQFSFDWLRHHYSQLNTKGHEDQSSTYLIVDEADNCMIDDMFYVARISDSFAGAQSLQPLYYHIWINFQELIKRMVEINGKHFLVKGYIQIIQDKLTLKYQNKYQNYYISDLKEEIIKNIQNNVCLKSLPFIAEELQTNNNYLLFIKNRMKKNINQMLQRLDYLWSSYAKQYAKKQVNMWVQSLIIAQHMSENKDYMVSHSKTIKVVDYKKTGIVQSNTSLSHAVHQFLQCKHRCPLTMETRTTNYLSYYSMFRKYNNRIIGLTGTVGTQKTKKLFQNIYQASCSIVPKFMKDMMHQIPQVNYSTKQQWIENITQKSIIQANKGRGVLIVCLTISLGRRIAQNLRKKYNQNLITTYFSNEEGDQGDREPNTCRKEQIIVATNLAGRGTDIKTEESVQSRGGLHVILTFQPDSERVQMQIKGRTSRNGKFGSFQKIIYNQPNCQGENDSNSEEKEKKQREKQIKIIEMQDRLFVGYNNWLKSVRKERSRLISQLNTQFTLTEDSVIISQIQDRFSQIITEIQQELFQNKDISQIQKNSSEKLQNLKKDYKNFKNSSTISTKYKFFRNGCYLLKLANAQLQSNSEKWKLTTKPQQLKDILDLAEVRDKKNFNVYYLKAYFYLKGKVCTFGKNDHSKDYKKESLKNLQEAKKLLQNQMSGYESVVLSLTQKKQSDGKMCKQFEKKLQICYECLQSIQRIKETITMSFYPINLKIHFNDNRIKTYPQMDTNNIQHQLITARQKFQKMQLTCQIADQDIINNSGQKLGKISILGKGPIKPIVDFWKKIKDHRFQQARIRIINLRKSYLQSISNFQTQQNSSIKIELEIQKQYFLNAQEAFFQIDNPARILYKKHQIQTRTSVQKLNKDIVIVHTSNKNLRTIKQKLVKQQIIINLTYVVQHPNQALGLFQIFSEIEKKYQKGKQNQNSLSPIFQFQIFDNNFKTKDNDINSYSSYSQMSKQIPLKLKFFSSTFQNAEKIVQKLKESLKDKNKQVDITKIKKLSQLYPKTNCPVVEILQMKNRGFQIIFQVNNRKPIPWGALAALTTIAAGQIALGACLMISGAGSSLGTAIISQSLNQIFTIFDVINNREFQWKSYLIQKGISLTITVCTLGLSAFTGTGQMLVVAGEELAQKGIITGIKTLGKCLLSQQGKTIMSLVGKKLVIETSQQIVTRLTTKCLSFASDKIVQMFQQVIQKQIHEKFSQNDPTLEQIKRFRILERFQTLHPNKTRYLNLKQIINRALYPQKKCTLLIQAINGLKTVGNMYCSVSNSKSSLSSIIQISSVVSLMMRGISEPLSLMRLLLKKQVFQVCYPMPIVQKYLNQRSKNDTQKMLIKNQIEIVNRNRKQQIKAINNDWRSDVKKQIIGDQLTQLTRSYFNRQNEQTLRSSKFQKFCQKQIRQMGIEDIQWIQKVLIDFVMNQIKNNIKSRVVSKYVAPFVNKNFVIPFVKSNLNKLLVDKNQNHKLNLIKLENIKNSQVKTEGDVQFMNNMQHPTVDSQLQSYCAYRSANMTSKYLDIILKRKQDKTRESKPQILQDLKKLRQDGPDELDEAQLKMIAKSNNLLVRTTRDPQDKLSQQQIDAGVQLLLFKQGCFDNEGKQMIGHYNRYDKNTKKFVNAVKTTQTSCALDCLREILKQKGIIVSCDQLKKDLIDFIQKNPSTYKNCKDAFNFLKVQYKKHYNSLAMNGGMQIENNQDGHKKDNDNDIIQSKTQKLQPKKIISKVVNGAKVSGAKVSGAKVSGAILLSGAAVYGVWQYRNWQNSLKYIPNPWSINIQQYRSQIQIINFFQNTEKIKKLKSYTCKLRSFPKRERLFHTYMIILGQYNAYCIQKQRDAIYISKATINNYERVKNYFKEQKREIVEQINPEKIIITPIKFQALRHIIYKQVKSRYILIWNNCQHFGKKLGQQISKLDNNLNAAYKILNQFLAQQSH